jgi:tetratricopeptide (TPR) repeat protein
MQNRVWMTIASFFVAGLFLFTPNQETANAETPRHVAQREVEAAINQSQDALVKALLLISQSYKQRGHENKSASDLEIAIEISRLIFPHVKSQPQQRLVWNNIGQALQELGALQDDPKALGEAANAYKQAISAWPRAEDTADWAVTQQNLGQVLSRLGQMQDDQDKLKAAIAAYRMSLEILSSKDEPQAWSLTQGSLGEALEVLGRLSNDPQYLEHAIQAYKATQTIVTRKSTPIDWAILQCAIGDTLAALSDMQGRDELLEQGLAAYGEALEIFTQTDHPAKWINVQYQIALIFIGRYILFDNNDDRLRALEYAEKIFNAYRKINYKIGIQYAVELRKSIQDLEAKSLDNYDFLKPPPF